MHNLPEIEAGIAEIVASHAGGADIDVVMLTHQIADIVNKQHALLQAENAELKEKIAKKKS